MKVVKLFDCILNAVKVAGEETYYPEHKRKSKMTRIVDNIKWVFKYREHNESYNLYGMDIKANDTHSSNYIDGRSFYQSRNKLNTIGKYSQNAILRDKLLFFRYMSDIGIPVPTVFAIVFEGKILNLDFKPADIEVFKKRKDYFVKDIDGECAFRLMQIDNYDIYNKNSDFFSAGRFIVQESLIQHSEMNGLNPQSVNTLRLVTTMDKNTDVQLFAGLLRIGTSKSGKVDNVAKGGIAVGIKKDGYLHEYGYYKPEFGTKTHMHPDSKIEFKTFQIPYYDQAVELAVFAHKYFYGLHSIGWDIAITENGCVFIEGNDNWEINRLQVFNCGLKNEWYDSMRKHQI